MRTPPFAVTKQLSATNNRNISYSIKIGSILRAQSRAAVCTPDRTSPENPTATMWSVYGQRKCVCVQVRAISVQCCLGWHSSAITPDAGCLYMLHIGIRGSSEVFDMINVRKGANSRKMLNKLKSISLILTWFYCFQKTVLLSNAFLTLSHKKAPTFRVQIKFLWKCCWKKEIEAKTKHLISLVKCVAFTSYREQL